MNESRRLLLLGALLLPAVLPAQRQDLSIYIHPTELTGKKKQRIDPRPQAELEARAKVMRDSVGALENALRSSHGKKESEWPAEAFRPLQLARRQLAVASFEVELAEGNPEDIRQVEEWLSEAIDKAAKGGLLRRAPTPAEADMVLQVRGVRSWKTVESYIKPNDCRQYFTLRPGGAEGSASLFGSVPAEWGFSGLRNAWRGPTDVSQGPVLLLEAGSGGGSIIRCWGKATDAAIDALTELRAALRAPSSAAPQKP